MLPVRDCSVEVLLQVWCNPPWHYCSQTWLWIVLWFLEWIYDAWYEHPKEPQKESIISKKRILRRTAYLLILKPSVGVHQSTHSFCDCWLICCARSWAELHVSIHLFLNLHQKLLSVLDGMLCVGIGISKNNEWSQHYIKRTPEEQLKHSLSTTKLGIAALEWISLRLSLLLACYCIVII